MMSVKGKAKRCNAEINRLKNQLETTELSNRRLRQKLDSQIGLARIVLEKYLINIKQKK